MFHSDQTDVPWLLNTTNRNDAFVVIDGAGAVEGVVPGENLAALGHASPTAVIGDVVQSNYVVVTPDNSVWDVVAAMHSTDSAIAWSLRPRRICQPVVCKES